MEKYTPINPTLEPREREEEDPNVFKLIINIEDASGYIPEGTYPAEEYYKLKQEADRRRAADERP